MNDKAQINLVTGATGLVGSHLLWHLMRRNLAIRAVKRRVSDLTSIKKIFSYYGDTNLTLFDTIQWVDADINYRFDLSEALQSVHHVYHCAANVSLNNASSDMYTVNVRATSLLLQQCIGAGVSRFCFVSSISTLGHAHDENLIDECSAWVETQQHSDYAKSKFLAEMEVMNATKSGLEVVIVNPGVILGYSGNRKGMSHLFLLCQKGCWFYTSGASGYVGVKDVVELMVGLMHLPYCTNERYIITAQNYTIKEILTIICQCFDNRPPFILIPQWLISMVGYCMEHLGKTLGFSPSIDSSIARVSTSKSAYSNQKIISLMNHQFTAIPEVIADICKYLRVSG